MSDVHVMSHGSIMTFEPCTDAARQWIDENVQDDAKWWCGALAVEARYARDLAQGMIDAGLTLE